MDSKRIDIVVGTVLCMLSVAVYVYAEQYTGRGVNSYGPNFFPQALSVLLFLASAVLIVRALTGHALKGLERINKPGLFKATGTLIISVVYLLMMTVVGFFVATVGFLYMVMMFIGQKGQTVRILSSLIVSVVIYCIFYFFLKIPLPEGIFQGDI
jgi:hypothetical protein